jgi:hypothetical protein
LQLKTTLAMAILCIVAWGATALIAWAWLTEGNH